MRTTGIIAITVCVFVVLLRFMWEKQEGILPDRLGTVENTGELELDVSEESCSRLLPKLKSASNQTSCTKVGENPYPTMNRKHIPFPTDLQCKLVVIAAGSARCGSTTQLAYARDALRLLGVPTMTQYWNIHLHFDVIPEDQKTAKGTELSQKLRIAANQKDLLVMKSHEYDPRLIRLCQHALVLTSHRHPFEKERSMKETFRNNPNWNIPEAATPQRCWVNSGSLDRVVKVVDQAYEGFKEDPVHSFLEVFVSVEEAVLQAGIPTKRPKAIAKELWEVIDHLSDEKNPHLPSSRQRQELTEADYWTTDERTKIACLYRRWFDRYNYTYT